jgi:uncharacterized membrane protein
MKNLRFPALVMVALALGFIVMLAASAHSLPAQVASHFDAKGHANGWTDRSSFLWMMGSVGLIFPAVFAVFFLIMWFAPSLLKAPKTDAPTSAPGFTFSYILRRSFWFGSMTLCFIAAVQALIVEANCSTPPRLQTATLLAVLIGFTVGVMFWSFSLLHHFSSARRSSRLA